MIRQQAFSASAVMLKGGLHCHTTRSDGKLPPEDVIRLHKANGYDFLAITDHRNYNFRNFAPETGLTIIPGMEYDDTFEYDGHGFRTFHTVCIGPEKDRGNGYEQDQRVESGKGKRQEEYQPYLDEIHARGNMTIYCHPEWSSTPARYFDKLEGNFAMEIWNSGCAIENDMDTDAAYWDELLGQGKRIFGVATDDGHQEYQHCKGWVMVNAENSVDSILAALREGKFYSSTGPVIRDFFVDDDGTAHVECSGVRMIKFLCDKHPTRVIRGESLTSAEAQLGKGWDGVWDYVRVAVYAADGTRAWSNPIWLN